MPPDILGWLIDVLARGLDEPAYRPEYDAAGLMLEWHAAYEPAAFEAVASRCDALLDRARGEETWSTFGYLHCAPLVMAADLYRAAPGPLAQLPDEIAANLWHHKLAIRGWMRQCVLVASSRVNADMLREAYERSAAAHHLDLDELAGAIACCVGGARVLGELAAPRA